MRSDYSLIEFTHKLSSYEVKFPIWKGLNQVCRPFESWTDKTQENWQVLKWYQAYNKSKHDRHNHFDKATLRNLLDAVCGLVVLLSAQFMDESYSPHSKGMGIGGGYSYDYDPTMKTAIGGYFRVKYPNDWDKEDQYGFDWQKNGSESTPIDIIDFDLIKASNT